MCQALAHRGKQRGSHCLLRMKGWFPLTTTTWDPNPSIFPHVTLVTLPKQTGRKQALFREGFYMNLCVQVIGQEEKNKNYFPQGCELKRIKPNLGTFSTLSAPHDKVYFCLHPSAGRDRGSMASLCTVGSQTLLPGPQQTPSHLSVSLTGSCCHMSKWAGVCIIQTKVDFQW